jgi:hypothetical protein
VQPIRAVGTASDLVGRQNSKVPRILGKIGMCNRFANRGFAKFHANSSRTGARGCIDPFGSGALVRG